MWNSDTGNNKHKPQSHPAVWVCCIKLWPRTSHLINIGKLLGPVAARMVFKRQYKWALSEQHFQWCSFQTAGNHNRGKNAFFSAQGVLGLKLQTHVFINTTDISWLVVLMQIFTYFKLACKWSLVESHGQAQLTGICTSKPTAVPTANSRSQYYVYVVTYFDIWLGI